MNTHDKIKKALECCMRMNGCIECPYEGKKCVVEHATDTLAYIQQLEEENRNFVTAIHALAEPMPKWISVEDGLPSDTHFVLMHHKLHGVGAGFYRPALNEWLSKMGWYDDVTHWMPLPEPPKEET